MASNLHTVCFRLDKAVFDDLRLIGRLMGESVSDVARRVIAAGLPEVHRAALDAGEDLIAHTQAKRREQARDQPIVP